MYVIFLILLFAMLVIIATISFLSEKKFSGTYISEKIKCNDYLQSIAFLWGCVIVILIMCLIGEISFDDIGIRTVSFNYNTWFTATTLIISGLFVAYLVYQSVSLLVSPKAREEAKKLDTGEGASLLLPRTKKEKKLFTLICISAGVCEEIIFRGFLVFLLHAIFPSISIVLIVLISSLIFGCSHLYQGVPGVLKTGAAGVVLICLVIVTNSLIPAIILHFLIDFSSVFLLSEDNHSPQAQT